MLEIYNHQSNRNYATSYQIDLFAIKLSEEIHKNIKQMVKSFALLPPSLRIDLSCVIGGKFSSGFISGVGFSNSARRDVENKIINVIVDINRIKIK